MYTCRCASAKSNKHIMTVQSMLEIVEGGLYLMELFFGVAGSGGYARGYVLCAALYVGGCGS